jgi:hypothetical protein
MDQRFGEWTTIASGDVTYFVVGFFVAVSCGDSGGQGRRDHKQTVFPLVQRDDWHRWQEHAHVPVQTLDSTWMRSRCALTLVSVCSTVEYKVIVKIVTSFLQV